MKKLQAAMEYLMTYGWAILIIALALGVLYSLGVFNPNRLKPVGCFLPAPFTCQIQTYNTAGSLTLLIGQGTGQTITINGAACVDNSLLTNNGLPTNVPSLSQPKTLASGGATSITVTCTTQSGSFTGKIGDTFSGSLVIQYTIGSSTYYTVGSISAQINTP